MDKHDLYLVWMDLEMTGLDENVDRILECACVVTTKNLGQVGEPFTVVIGQDESVLSAMNDWCQEHHADSGLTDEVRRSTVTEQQAEQMLLDYLRSNNVPAKTVPICGRSIHVDRRFLRKYMPRVDDYLSHTVVDVTSFCEMCRRINPSIHARMHIEMKRRRSKLAKSKQLSNNCQAQTVAHRALPDTIDAIETMRFLKKYFLHS